MEQHVLAISEGEAPRVFFPLPADRFVARAIFVFLAENLRPGFAVQLQRGETAAITLESGTKLSGDEFAALMDADAP